MASPSYHLTVMLFMAFATAFVLAASANKVVGSGCNHISARDICDLSMFPSSCHSVLNPVLDSDSAQPDEILGRATKAAISALSTAALHFAVNETVEKLANVTTPNVGYALSAVRSCRDLLSVALYGLNSSLTSKGLKSDVTRYTMKNYLCAAGADVQTCLDEFDNLAYNLKTKVSEILKNSSAFTSNSLTILTEIEKCANSDETDSFMKRDYFLGQSRDNYPYWLSSEDRRLLQDSRYINPNVVVAKDGSGNYKTIYDALKAAPDSSYERFVIYVKKGVYYENVKVEKYKWNIMMYGDGQTETIVSANLNSASGLQTLDTATFSVYGQGFIARDMGFYNTAGTIKRQAVALLSYSDQSVFFRCRIDGYQDTLCIQNNRQFYRECNIYGTVDFIFGFGAAVIQNSTILARKPLSYQRNTIIANQRYDPKCNTGFVIQQSSLKAAENLAGVDTYLGRPLRPYSTAVFLENWMDNLINPRGWLPKNDSAGAPPPPTTIFLAEYGNMGPGSVTANRVKWPGVNSNLSVNDANKFTVRSLINGDQWLPATNVPFNLDL